MLIVAAEPIITTNLLQTLPTAAEWDKDLLTATKTVLFNQAASGGTDATVIEKVKLSFFTSLDCTGALLGSAFYTTPTGNPYTINVGTSFGLTAEGAWNVGKNHLALSFAEMASAQSIATTFMSKITNTPQSDFSGNSFACIQVTCTAGTPGESTSVDGTQSFELKETAAVGDPADGGVIACQNTGAGSNLYNLVSKKTDTISWGVTGSTTGATSMTDGASNTSTIVACYTSGTGDDCTYVGAPIDKSTYAAGVCDDFTTAGGYTSGWYLAAGNSTTSEEYCLFSNKNTIGGFGTGNYWPSTERSSTNAARMNFGNGASAGLNKTITLPIRCVRAFTP